MSKNTDKAPVKYTKKAALAKKAELENIVKANEIEKKSQPTVSKKTKAIDTAKKVGKEVGKKAIAEGAKKFVENKGLEKLSAHALKHLKNWHAKAGADGGKFAKMLAKHTKNLVLIKVQQQQRCYCKCQRVLNLLILYLPTSMRTDICLNSLLKITMLLCL